MLRIETNTSRSNGKKRPSLLVWLFFVLLLLTAACKKKASGAATGQGFAEIEKKIARYSFPVDSLLMLLSESEKKRDDRTLAAVCKVMGQRMRDRSNFSEAIIYHQNGLNAALRLKDTIGTAQLLNQLGTDFRRIGAFPEASDYHFRALRLSETYSRKDDFAGKKNKVMALNGIGNIYLSLENLPEALNYFRQALSKEKELGSALGQAINYANIGNVYKMTQQYDSALAYYRHSMEQNTVAKSKLGIGLCHIHFGEIHERRKEYDKAEVEYQEAYKIMENISDKWHWLRACLSLGRINLLKKKHDQARQYILLAKVEAERIDTPEQLSEVYNLLHQLYEREGDYRRSLDMFRISKAYQDSVRNISKVNQALDMRINYEREKSTLRIDQLSAQYEAQKREKKIITAAAAITVVLMVLFLATLAYAYVQRDRSNKILKNVDKMRSDFFTNVTHEFRTPLTVILGFISRFRGQLKMMTPAEYAGYLDAMERQGDNLLQLVNRMLDMAKMEAGVAQPEWNTGNIVAYLEMVVESFRLYAREKMVELVFYAEEPVIEMDFVPHYVNEIARNLLSNAIKFTPAGGKITLSVTPLKNNWVVIKVRDNGKGISSEDLKRIFEPFYQSPDADRNAGSGIGLHYTRQLAEAMCGSVSAESKKGEGSVFTVVLPVKQSGNLLFSALKIDEVMKTPPYVPKNEQGEEGPGGEDEHADVSAAETGTTVLVVEDNSDIVLYIKSLLPPSYRVIHARDGQEGLDLANGCVPDLIISDVMMPHKDGFSLCREVKSSELLNHVPVILLTAKSAVEDQLTGLKCGADAYIRKPFHPGELLIRVDKLLESRRILKEKYLRAIFKGSDGNSHHQGAADVNLNFLQRVTDIVYREMCDPDFASSVLADKLSLSISQLNRKMMAISGHTPTAYILNLRINKAKKILASQDLPITEVADECGFSDLAYFSRTFKKHTGVTPSQYRRLPH
ncbi:hybrid sensor histidine kinase/response regulator transcription factor [Bacteroides pyogenes]|uniref:hybrid sensor histidine kinase/response regulator transcription factor n=1 Tax=Bacteroides pyogenes TaxID=310300 RepID=UPI001BADDC41|nr:ATP-binding protein [Bacteroides pyogenes]MBR8706441.1 Sensor histidine kinase RcsC [Bacteroides pyogenes]